MENVVLTIHLLLALALVIVVLMQRSEGGGLGMGGGGGGGGGVMSGRAAATALSKVTWVLAIGFICTSITLTILGAQGTSSSVLDRIGGASAPAPSNDNGGLGSGDSLLPPSAADGNAPLVPQITE